MHDSSHSCLNGCFKYDLAILSGNIVVETFAVMVVADPVCIVQHIGTTQRLDQCFAVFEIEGMDLDLPIKGVVTADCIGQRPYPLPVFQKMMSNPPASVTERSCHDMQASVHVVTSSL